MSTPVDVSEAVELTRDLVRINTTNPPGNELPAVRMVEERLRGYGFETTFVPYHHPEDGEDTGQRGHVVARLRGNGERPGLLFSGHLDVVPPGNVPWSVEPFGAEIRDGRMYGRGSCDMKSGVAALVTAAGALARSGRTLKGDLVVAITADEERNCLGVDQLVREPLFSGLGSVLVAEPTSLRLFVAEKGAFWMEVAVYGKTAHGSMPALGANAVSAMAEFLYRWEQTYSTEEPRHPILGTPTLNVGTIQGGVKVNVVPDACICQIDMRTVPPQEHEALLAQAQTLLSEVTVARAGTRGEVRVISNRPPVSCPVDSPLAVALAEAVREIADVDPTLGGVPYCTEACVWVPELQIPAVICGPGDPGMAHQPDEFVPLADIENAARIYTRVTEQLLG